MERRAPLAAALCALASSAVLVCWVAPVVAGDPVEAQRVFAAEHKPMLQEFCIRCHGGDKPKGDLNLAALGDAADVGRDTAAWHGVLDRLQAGDMPPEDEKQPSGQQVAGLVAWIEAQAAAAGPPNPGRVTVRRLNRVEYNNTIRDLVGLDFHPADDFPADDSGYGFDNIGDVLSLPPLLMEKYLSAAQAIAERAIVAHPGARVVVNLPARNAEHPGRSGHPFGASAWQFPSNGELHIGFDAPAESEYLLKVAAFGQQAGTDPARMALRIDGQQVALVDVPATEQSAQTYEVRTRLTAGHRRLAVAFVNDFYNPKDPNPNNRDRNLVIQSLAVEGPLDAGPDYPDTHRRIIWREPQPGQERALAAELLQSFAARAYRRPVSQDEVERLVKFVELALSQGDNFNEGMQVAMQAVLVSPHFLFRLELDPAAGGPESDRALTDFEIASRLSYFLWSSMPDAELTAAAQAGKLQEPAMLAEQVVRMLKDPKSRALVDNFAGQWLQLRNLTAVAPDKQLFPEFDDSLRAAMRTETEQFFAAIVAEDRNVLDFVDADFTFLNERLARHYGIDNVQGDQFRRVTLSGGQRGGVLSQASVLTVTSNPTRTSPVKRGRWVLDNLLGAPPPPPPPQVPELNDTPAGALQGSLRERMEQHRTKAECASCHSRMDPIGFGLENYNAIGAWRTQDGNFAIDASATLGGKSFVGPAELRKILQGRERQFVRCLSEKLLTYGLGRGLESYDRPSVEAIVEASARGGHRFSSVVAAIVQSDPFLKRRVPGATP